MNRPTRFQLLFAAIMLVGALVLWPGMRRLRTIDACLKRGDTWDYSAHTCGPAINPHAGVGAPTSPR